MIFGLSIALAVIFGITIHQALQKKRKKFIRGRLPLAINYQLTEAGFKDQQLQEAVELFHCISKAFNIPSDFLRLTDTLITLSESDSILGNSEGITEIEVLLKKNRAKNLSVNSNLFEVIETILGARRNGG